MELSASILQLHQIIDVLREQIRDLQDRVSILEVRSGDSLPSEPVVVPTTAPVISTPIVIDKEEEICGFYNHI